METRHSKQIPMLHSTLRGCPVTEILQAVFASITATATVVPGKTATGTAFTVSTICSGMSHPRENTRREERLYRNHRFPIRDLVNQKPCRRERSCDAQALVSGGEPDGFVIRPRADQRKLVGSSRAEARPDADRGHGRQSRQIFFRSLQHADKDCIVYFAVVSLVLA